MKDEGRECAKSREAGRRTRREGTMARSQTELWAIDLIL